MKIIIAGAGEVGFHLAKLLSFEEHDISIIDKSEKELEYIENHLDVMVVRGDSTSPSVLNQARINTCDLLIAVTSSEATNFSTCIIGHQMGAKKTIARISNTEFLVNKEHIDYQALGIDFMISPEYLASEEISHLLDDTAFTDAFEFEGGLLKLVGIELTEEDSGFIVNKTVKKLSQEIDELHFMPVAIQRGTKTLIPRGNTKFLVGDHAYFVSLPEGVEEIRKACGRKKIDVNKIMILGGSQIGYKSAKALSKKYNVKIIEKNKDKCFELADKLPDTLVLNADGRNVALLEEENIENMDVFIAVTGDSETNIMSCLVAKSKGAKKTVALVENIDYIPLSQTIGVNTLLNKKVLAANSIFRHIRQGEVISLVNLHDTDAEVLEFEVKENSKITKSSIKKLNFPQGAVIGGLVRNGEGMMTLGDMTILPKDRVVVFSVPSAVHQVEEFFT